MSFEKTHNDVGANQPSLETRLDDGDPPAATARMSRAGVFQLRRTLELWRFWVALAWQDWRRRYRRSAIGAAWVFISFALFVGVKILIFGAMSQQEIGFFSIWLSVGFLIWVYISSNVVEGCNVFIASSRWIKGADIPYLVYVFQSVMRSIIQFLLSLGVVVVALVFFPPSNPLVALSALLALPLYILSALWVQTLLGVFCARFRDAVHLTQTAVRLLFFLTPILWVPADFGRFGEFAIYNPFTHFIAIVRDPLAYGTIPWASWGVVSAITLVGLIAAAAVFSANRHRIVFWV